MTTKRAIKMKSGETVLAGAKVSPSETHTLALVHGAERTYRVKYQNLGLKVPSENTLMRWSDDGIAKSVNGKKTEPDGIDADGFPSWLLALGLI